MNIQRYTEKAQNILQSAQTLAIGSGHQKLLPEHLLNAIFADSDNLAQKLIWACNGNFELAKAEVTSLLKNLPSVEGSGSGSLTMSQELARIFILAEKIADENKDSFVTVERLLQAILEDEKNEAAKVLKMAGLSVNSLREAITKIRAGKKADSASSEATYQSLEKYATDLIRLLVVMKKYVALCKFYRDALKIIQY